MPIEFKITSYFSSLTKNKIQTLLKEHSVQFNLFQNQNILVEIIVPNNFNDTLYKLSHLEYQKQMDLNGIPNHNGITILPADEDYSKFIILLKNDIFNSLEYLSTVTHELTHLIDFLHLFSESGNVYNGLVQYDAFFFWTEFNAKFKGVKRIKSELDNKGLVLSLEHMTIAFIEQINQVLDKNKRIYLLIHYLARLSIYDSELNLNFDKSIYPIDYLDLIFGKNIPSLYKLLCQLKSYSDFQKKEGELHRILATLE